MQQTVPGASASGRNQCANHNTIITSQATTIAMNGHGMFCGDYSP